MKLRNKDKDILNRLIHTLCEDFEAEINEDSKFVDDLNFDSMDVAELVMEIEREFNVNIQDSAVGQIVTVKDAYDLLEQVLINK